MSISTKSGFVSIVGKPNVGKSSLLNSLIEQKISVVTPKPQTTRNNIIGIYSKNSVQIVFLDTPGFLRPNYKLHEFMRRELENSFIEADIILLVLDASVYEGNVISDILKEYEHLLNKTITFCVLNKIDLCDKSDILHMINDISVKFKFFEIFPVSAKKSFNTPELLDSIIKYLPKGEFYFENDIIASQPERFFVAEIVRAEVMKLCRDEIPFSVFIEIEEFIERKNSKTYIRLNLILDKESHKKIIVGKEGSMIKRIGSHSRKNVEEFLGKEVYLDIFVKVKKNWKDDDNFLRSYFKRHTLIS